MKNYTFLILFIIFFFPYCGSKNIKAIQKDNRQIAVSNIIEDFLKTESAKINTVYNVSEYKDSKYLFCFALASIDNKFSPGLKDSIFNGKSSYFPTMFKEINDVLFVWNDTSIATNEQVIKKLHQYKMIDSTNYKIDIGEVAEDNWPILKTDDSKQAIFYYVCKKDILKFRKIKSNKILKVKKYPNMVCD